MSNIKVCDTGTNLKTPRSYLLSGAICADDVLELVCVGVLEAEAAGAQPHVLARTLRTEAVHHRHHLTLHLQHCKVIKQPHIIKFSTTNTREISTLPTR